MGEVSKDGIGSGGGELLGAGAAGGHADDMGPRLNPGCYVVRCIADEHGRGFVVVGAVGFHGARAGDVDQAGPLVVIGSVGADVQVEIPVKVEDGEFQLRGLAGVSGEDGLRDAGSAGAGGQDVDDPGEYSALGSYLVGALCVAVREALRELVEPTGGVGETVSAKGGVEEFGFGLPIGGASSRSW